MKKYFIISCLCLLSFSGFSLSADFAYNKFSSGVTGQYIETYLYVYPKDLSIVKQAPGKYGTAVKIEITFFNGTKQVKKDSYTLRSAISDSLTVSQSTLVDLQRYILPDGEINFKVEISDLNKLSNNVSAEGKCKLGLNKTTLNISDILLSDKLIKSEKTSRFNRNGYDLYPNIYSFYGNTNDTMIYYLELYPTTEQITNQETIIATATIENVNNGKKIEPFSKFFKIKSKEIYPLLDRFPLEDLPTGNYQLNVEVKNSKNEVIASNKIPFQRYNKNINNNLDSLSNLSLIGTFVEKMGAEELQFHIKSVFAISDRLERIYANNLLQEKNPSQELMGKFLYNFWNKRGPQNEEKRFNDYLAEVRKVNETYKCKVGYGFETERGRVYLQFGPPNSVSKRENDGNALPYEIWWYYALNNGSPDGNNRTQRNVRFIFVNKDLITCDYRLIHSDAFGEVSNNQWQLELYGRTTPLGNSIDALNPQGGDQRSQEILNRSIKNE